MKDRPPWEVIVGTHRLRPPAGRWVSTTFPHTIFPRKRENRKSQGRGLASGCILVLARAPGSILRIDGSGYGVVSSGEFGLHRFLTKSSEQLSGR